MVVNYENRIEYEKNKLCKEIDINKNMYHFDEMIHILSKFGKQIKKHPFFKRPENETFEDLAEYINSITLDANIILTSDFNSFEVNKKNVVKHLRNVHNRYQMLLNGKKGEEQVLDVLSPMLDKIAIYTNIRLKVNDNLDTENDLIVVSKKGIALVEVKFLKRNAHITSSGILTTNSNSYIQDIGQQINRHIQSVRRSIMMPFYEATNIDLSLESYIVSANKQKKIHSSFEYISAISVNALPFELFKDKEDILSDEAYKLLNVIIEEQFIVPKKYPLDISIGQISQSIAELIVQKNEIETKKHTKMTKFRYTIQNVLEIITEDK